MNKSLTTKNNERALTALSKITPLTVTLRALERSSAVWKARNSIPTYLESEEVFAQNMQLIDEDNEEMGEYD